MTRWTTLPMARSILTDCAVSPPPTRVATYAFQETATLYTGERVKRLERIYRDAEPAIDTPEWREWLALTPQKAIAEAVGQYRRNAA